MIKNIYITIILFAIFTFVGIFALNLDAGASSVLFADSQSQVCDGATLIMGGDCDTATGKGLSKIIQTVAAVFAWVLGILAVILIMYGGFKYVISGGDSNKVSGAKNTIMYAIIGLVVAVIAQPLVKFIINLFTK